MSTPPFTNWWEAAFHKLPPDPAPGTFDELDDLLECWNMVLLDTLHDATDDVLVLVGPDARPSSPRSVAFMQGGLWRLRSIAERDPVDPNGDMRSYLFLCPWCGLWTHYDDGGADAHGEACSPCWCALEAGERPVPHPEHGPLGCNYPRHRKFSDAVAEFS